MNTTKRQKNRKHNTNKKQKIQQETVAQLHLDWDGELGWGTQQKDLKEQFGQVAEKNS